MQMFWIKTCASTVFVGLISWVPAVYAQEPVPVGKGSFASFVPPNQEHGTKAVKAADALYIVPSGAKRPIPSNQWWTDLIIRRYCGELWAHPLTVSADERGINVFFPADWNADGSHLQLGTPLCIRGEVNHPPDPTITFTKTEKTFRPADARALAWSDWTLTFRAAQSSNEFMDVTLGHGLPYVWIETKGIVPLIPVSAEVAAFDDRNAPIAWPLTGDHIGLVVSGRCFAVCAPTHTRFTRTEDGIKVAFAGTNTYLVVAALPSRQALPLLYQHAYAIPRSSRLDWTYDPAAAAVTTRWHLDTVPLRGAETDTIQGWLPHHYRETTRPFAFNGLEYATPRGRLQCATGRDFTITWRFDGLLPALPVPVKSGGANDYDLDRMNGYVARYTNRTDYGGDTYWGGKHLLQYGAYMSMARELGHPAFATLRDTLRRALTDWFTYTPGEKEHFFARYDTWGALVGFKPSYGSEEFTDNHFHYGYFTTASALLGLYDPSFLKDYGDMARLVAKQYANWDRDDQRFPFLRTFDIWEGHSWAGGRSSPGGNNQESSSEAMQSWGGLFMLGSALGDKGMTAAGAMGYAMEAAATREYWFDVYATNHPAAYRHSVTGILFGNGQAYATYFSGDPAWIHGIQWLPMTPLLSYLARNPKFARQDFANMISERKAKEGRADIGSLGTGLGNVALSFAAQFDPDWAAAQMDELWAGNNSVAHDNDTGGMTYYMIHANRMLGRRQWDWHMDLPTSAVYLNEKTHAYSYVAFNPAAKPVTARVFKQDHQVGTLIVPARTLVRTAELSALAGGNPK